MVARYLQQKLPHLTYDALELDDGSGWQVGMFAKCRRYVHNDQSVAIDADIEVEGAYDGNPADRHFEIKGTAWT